MFDYGDVIAYLLLVLLDQVPGHSQQLEGESFEITDIIRRAIQGQAVPVKLASGKTIYLIFFIYPFIS